MIDAGIFLALQDAHAAEGQRFHLVFTGHDADRRDEFDVVSTRSVSILELATPPVRMMASQSPLSTMDSRPMALAI